MRIQFDAHDGVYTGTGGAGRYWTVSRVFTGWRLEFRDVRGTATRYSGVHRTLKRPRPKRLMAALASSWDTAARRDARPGQQVWFAMG